MHFSQSSYSFSLFSFYVNNNTLHGWGFIWQGSNIDEFCTLYFVQTDVHAINLSEYCVCVFTLFYIFTHNHTCYAICFQLPNTYVINQRCTVENAALEFNKDHRRAIYNNTKSMKSLRKKVNFPIISM